MHGLDFHPEDLRQVLERHFSPTFGLGLDIATLVAALPEPEEGSPCHVLPPQALRVGFNPKLVEHQWQRLLAVVREPVAEWLGYDMARAVQILGQSVVMFLPDGTLYGWNWTTNREGDVRLQRVTMDQLEIPAWGADDKWLLSLQLLATSEYSCYSRIGRARAPVMARWQFRVFHQLLSRHADLAWMRVRLRRALGLDVCVAQQAESHEGPGSGHAVLTVGNYNSVRRNVPAPQQDH